MIDRLTTLAPDTLGILAAALVLATFTTTDFRKLRTIAVCSNIAFICYGLALGLWPVITLHGLLLPVNGWHLAKLVRAERRAALPKLPPVTRRQTRWTRTNLRHSMQIMGPAQG